MEVPLPPLGIRGMSNGETITIETTKEELGEETKITSKGKLHINEINAFNQSMKKTTFKSTTASSASTTSSTSSVSSPVSTRNLNNSTCTTESSTSYASSSTITRNLHDSTHASLTTSAPSMIATHNSNATNAKNGNKDESGNENALKNITHFKISTSCCKTLYHL